MSSAEKQGSEGAGEGQRRREGGRAGDVGGPGGTPRLSGALTHSLFSPHSSVKTIYCFYPVSKNLLRDVSDSLNSGRKKGKMISLKNHHLELSCFKQHSLQIRGRYEDTRNTSITEIWRGRESRAGTVRPGDLTG